MDSTFINLKKLIQESGLSLPDEFGHKKKKFMLVGTHAHQTTGYSKVTYNIIKELAKLDCCEISHFGFQKFMEQPPGYRDYPTGVTVYDPVLKERTNEAPNEMGFGYSQLASFVKTIKPDIIMIYNDAGVICQFLDKLKEGIKESDRTYKMIIYLDQVYIIQRPELLARIDSDAHIYFTFTKYWKEILEKQGIRKPIYILRHGFDPEQFKPMDKTAIRKRHNLPENLFLLLNLNRNTPRKRYDIVIQGFVELIARHPTKPIALLCVCDKGETGGFLIGEIYMRELKRLNLDPQYNMNKLIMSSSSMTYTDETINEMYAMSDLGITATEGEGFGLCHFEAMGIGIPQVVPEVGGFRDFCIHGVNSQVVPVKWRSYLASGMSSVGGIAEYIQPFDLSLAIEEYLLDSDLRKEHGKKARETVLEYKWSKEVRTLAKVIQEQ